MEFGQDLSILLKVLCTELKKKQLPFCLTGGWAVSMMGIARTTIDIDLLMVLDEPAKQEVVSVLGNSFKLIQSHDDEMEFKHMSIWRNIVLLPGNTEPFMVDLINAGSNYLKSVIERSIEIQYEEVSIPVVSIEDLIILKLYSFRKQDQVDIENLVHSGTLIDWKYLETTVKSSRLDWHFVEQIKSTNKSTE